MDSKAVNYDRTKVQLIHSLYDIFVKMVNFCTFAHPKDSTFYFSIQTFHPMTEPQPYQPNNKIRIVTAGSLFDGHDAAINIMRRIMQRSGAEIIHLGHNRSASEIVDTAIQEDVRGSPSLHIREVTMSILNMSLTLLKEKKCGHIKIFGGGGTILPKK